LEKGPEAISGLGTGRERKTHKVLNFGYVRFDEDNWLFGVLVVGKKYLRGGIGKYFP